MEMLDPNSDSTLWLYVCMHVTKYETIDDLKTGASHRRFTKKLGKQHKGGETGLVYRSANLFNFL